MKNDMLSFYAAAIPGTEQVLCDELRELGFKSVRLNRGGIPFRGDRREGWRACLQSRIAQRIQLLLSRFTANTKEALYDGVRAVDWTPYITPQQTISVGSVCVASDIDHSGFAALKVKDAIVDQIRSRTGKRPSVDKDDPDVRVFLYLANNKASLYLDLSGSPLHMRGYRKQTGEAPLRETLAAAILRMSGWDRNSPLIDPMCGSGTIAIEAAMWSANMAPGLMRKCFGFERWADFGEKKAEDLKELRGELRSAVRDSVRIVSSDIDSGILATAKANARTAGVRLTLKEMSVLDLQANDSCGTIVTNPPYGVRLEKDPGFCHDMGAVFSRMHGWRVCILAGSPDYKRAISRRPVSVLPVSNGNIKCNFFVYDMQ